MSVPIQFIPPMSVAVCVQTDENLEDWPLGKLLVVMEKSDLHSLPSEVMVQTLWSVLACGLNTEDIELVRAAERANGVSPLHVAQHLGKLRAAERDAAAATRWLAEHTTHLQMQAHTVIPMMSEKVLKRDFIRGFFAALVDRGVVVLPWPCVDTQTRLRSAVQALINLHGEDFHRIRLHLRPDPLFGTMGAFESVLVDMISDGMSYRIPWTPSVARQIIGELPPSYQLGVRTMAEAFVKDVV